MRTTTTTIVDCSYIDIFGSLLINFACCCCRFGSLQQLLPQIKRLGNPHLGLLLYRNYANTWHTLQFMNSLTICSPLWLCLLLLLSLLLLWVSPDKAWPKGQRLSSVHWPGSVGPTALAVAIFGLAFDRPSYSFDMRVGLVQTSRKPTVI